MKLQLLIRFLFGTMRGRLIVGVVAVNAVMMALLVGDLTLRQRNMLLDRQIEEASAMSLSLATSAAGWIAADDISGLQELVEVQRRYPEVVFAILVDRDGRVLADTNTSRVGLYMQDLPRQVRQTQLSATRDLVDVATPAIIGGAHVGWARVGLEQKLAGARLASITRDGILYALSAIIIGSLVAWSMGRLITRRLYAVQKTIDEVRSGNRLARSTLTGPDEAAVIAREFNTMLDSLAARDAELHLSEDRYRSLIQRVQAAIVLYDSQGVVLDSNPLARTLLGLPSDQLEGKSLSDPGWHFIRENGAQLPAQEHPASVVLTSKKPLRNQVLGIRQPGHEDLAWVLVSAEPEFDEAGCILQVIVSFVDVTERKEAEEALHRSNRELRAISSCNQTLMRAEDEQGLVDAICRIVCDEAGYRFAWVGYVLNDEAKTIHTVARAGLDEGYIEQAQLTWADTERGRGPAGVAVRTGQTACIQDFATEPQALPWREAALQRGYRSVISLPLKDEQAAFGILSIYSTQADAFTTKEVRLLEELAGDLAFGIITLRTRAERLRLEQQKEQYLRFFRLSTEAMGIVDAHGCFKEVNPAMTQVTGFLENELLSKPFLDFVHPDDRPTTAAEMKLQTAAHPSLHFENRCQCKNGSTVLLSWNAFLDTSDGVTYATARDVTERKRAEENQRAAALYARSLIEASLDPLVTISPQGKITDVNRTTEQATGLDRAELIGTDFADYFTEPEQARVGYRRVLEQGYVRDYPLTIRNRCGRTMDVLYNAAEYRNEAGELQGVFAAARDITERKQAQQALERANRALRTLSDCNTALVHSSTESGLLDSVCQLIVEKGGYLMAWVGVALDDAAKTVRPVAQFGDVTGFLRDARFSWSDATELGRGPTGMAVRTGTVQINQNYPTNPALLPWREAAARRGYQSSIALPLMGATDRLGVLTIYAPEPNAFDEAEVPLLRELAADLAFGMETLRTRAERDRIAYAHLHHEEILRKSLEQSIGAIADTVEARDPYTAGHQRRVAELAAAIARAMGLPDDRIQGIRLAASIHDLGKIQVPAEILAKPGRLSEIEFMLIKTHPESGFNILKGIQFPWPIADIVHQHHERIDGSGYPKGLKGDDILLESRILAVADVTEAMASHRPYRATLGIEVALGEIERGRGSIYDAAVADTCLALFREGRFAFKS